MNSTVWKWLARNMAWEKLDDDESREFYVDQIDGIPFAIVKGGRLPGYTRDNFFAVYTYNMYDADDWNKRLIGEYQTPEDAKAAVERKFLDGKWREDTHEKKWRL